MRYFWKDIQSYSDGVIIIQTDSDKFQKNSDRFSLIQNFLFMSIYTRVCIKTLLALTWMGGVSKTNIKILRFSQMPYHVTVTVTDTWGG